MNFDTLAVIVIVAIAAFFVVRRLVRQARSKGSGCGCSSGCSGCSSASGGIPMADQSSSKSCCGSGDQQR